MKALEVLNKREKFLKGEVGGYGYNLDAEYRMVTDRNFAEVKEAISELEALQQHIKDLESQLSSNPLQLTCETCKYFSWNGRGLGQCHNCSPQCPGYTLTDFGCIFHTKDKK